MSQLTIDERLVALDREVARVAQRHLGERQPAEKNWRSTIGIFSGDPIMKEIH